jgi:hypothetical protein
LDTAATIFGTLIQLIPERKIGYLIPKSSVILVFTVHAPALYSATGNGKQPPASLPLPVERSFTSLAVVGQADSHRTKKRGQHGLLLPGYISLLAFQK